MECIKLKDCSPGCRVHVCVKVVDHLLICESGSAKVCEILVADASGCAVCISSGKMQPGSVVELINVACIVECGRLVLKLDLWSRIHVQPEEVVMGELNMKDNFSWIEVGGLFMWGKHFLFLFSERTGEALTLLNFDG